MILLDSVVTCLTTDIQFSYGDSDDVVCVTVQYPFWPSSVGSFQVLVVPTLGGSL